MRGSGCPPARPCRTGCRTGNPARSSPFFEVPVEGPDAVWCFKAHRQSPHLIRFENAPEVRVLSSTGITRLQRGPRPCPTPVPTDATSCIVEAATLAAHGSPPLTRPTCLDVLCPLPRWTGPGAFVGCFPKPCCLPLYFGRVGVHDFPFEACSGFTHVTARRFARPPEAAFVAGLRRGRSPFHAACQLPGQPTIARVGLPPTK